MGFRKANLPAHIQDLDFSKLLNSQLWVLADWMNCRPAVARAPGNRPGKLAVLREHCMANLTRAQEGYEIITLGKTPSAPQTADYKAVEERLYSTVVDVLNSHRDTIDEKVADRLSALVDAAAEKVVQTMRSEAKAAIDAAARNAVPLVIKTANKTKKIAGPLPEEFKRMVQLGAARKNIMLVGPAGCGKTYLAAKLAEALDLDFADQSCSAGISESQFTGWLLPTGKNGAFEYAPAPFIEMYENGGVFLFDEMDAADANLLTFLNKALANDSFHLPQRIGKTLVKRHPDFVAVGAANTFGHGADAMYVGRNQLDAATLDRFRAGMINMDYSREVEKSLADPKLLNWAWGIRERIRTNGLRRNMSTRTIKDLADMVRSAGWSIKDCADAYFADWTNEERRIVEAA